MTENGINNPLLKACPFCGGAAKIEKDLAPLDILKVLCTCCGVEMPWQMDGNEAFLTDIWNRRV